MRSSFQLTRHTAARLALAILITCGWSAPLLAQDDCGTEMLPEHVDLVLARQAAGIYDPPEGGPRSGYSVPLTFHVVRRSDGTGGINPAQLVAALDDANLYFANAGIRFCWPGPVNYIDSDAFYYDIDTQAEIDALRQTNVVPDTINIYFTENLPYCGISSFTWSDVQGIVMNNGCAGTGSNPSTFPHELGHYFDLLHTHSTMFGAECVICCNCNIAGDLLCDTPADPNLSGEVDSNCGYTGTDLDPCDGVPYQPDTSNLMSYSLKECRTTLTTQQNFRMQATLTRLRPELMGDPCPPDEGAWIIDAKITAADGEMANLFGDAVAISGETAIVGAYGDNDNGSGSGSAYIFEKVGGSWVQNAKLTPIDGAANDFFGDAVSIDGDTAIIGAYRDDDRGSGSGSAYVFERAFGAWTQKAKFTARDGTNNDLFGNAVSIDGDTAIVGAYQNDNNNGNESGSAYVFERAFGVWTQKAKLTASDGRPVDRFGISVSISGDTAIVGAFYNDDLATNAGAAYVFEKVGGVWTEIAKLTASDGVSGDLFGNSVSIDGNTAIIGAFGDDGYIGSAYMFEKVDGEWTEVAKLTTTSGEQFGSSVSVSGKTAIVGASGDDFFGTDSGSAYVFEKMGGVWARRAWLLAPDGATDDYFGNSVSLSGDTAIVGAWGDDDRGDLSGSAYLWINTSPPGYCPGDFNEDGIVDTRDVIAFLSAWSDNDSSADFNEDGVIDTRDVIAFLSAWTEDC